MGINGASIMAGTKRTPVALTDQEREEIKTAMKSEGIRTIDAFLRIAALRLARQTLAV